MVMIEDEKARSDVWKFAYGLIKTRVIKCALELDIPDVLEKHGGPISLADLSSGVGCSTDSIYRIMRLLVHDGIFKRSTDGGSIHYSQTPLSRLLTKDNLGPVVLLRGTPPGTSGGITAEALRTGKRPDLKENIDGEDTWTDPEYGNHMKLFTDAMASHARAAVAAMIDFYAAGFEGITTLVDVGGRHGMALSMIVKAFPWVRGITFDLPEIVAQAPPIDGVQFVGGSMFDSVPKADAIMLMWILHDWSDEACIDILKKCKEAIPADTGKVMIVEVVVDDDEDEGDEYTGSRLALDLVMMAVTVKGKERTYKEWAYLLNAAGFSRHSVKDIKSDVSVIEAFP